MTKLKWAVDAKESYQKACNSEYMGPEEGLKMSEDILCLQKDVNKKEKEIAQKKAEKALLRQERKGGTFFAPLERHHWRLWVRTHYNRTLSPLEISEIVDNNPVIEELLNRIIERTKDTRKLNRKGGIRSLYNCQAIYFRYLKQKQIDDESSVSLFIAFTSYIFVSEFQQGNTVT